MPMLKQPSNLKYLCLKNIAENLERHALWHSKIKSEVTLYSPFQRHFSDILLEILLETESEVYYEGRRLTQLQVLFKEWEMGNKLSKRCLEFVFNTRLTKVFPANECEKQGYDMPVNLLLKLLYNCKHVTTLDFRGFSAINDQDFLPFVQHSLRNVVRLSVAYTRIGDETLLAIMRNCPLLTHLNLDGTEITDNGIKMLCGNYVNEGKWNLSSCCKNPTQCSIMPKLKCLNIDFNEITNAGVICILQHFPFLNVLKYEISRFCVRNLDHSFYQDSIPKALALLQKQTEKAPCCKLNLEKLKFVYSEDVEKNFQKALLLCPKLKVFKALVPLSNWQFSLLAKFEYLTDVTFSIEDESTLKSTEFQSFLLLKGHKLTSFKLKGCLFIQTSSLFSVLSHCRNLRELHFIDIKLLPSTANELSHNTSIEAFKNSVSLKKLETFTISNIYGYKSAVSELVATIISTSRNIINLRITHSRVDDKAFWPVETCNALCNLRVLIFHRCNITEKSLWRLIKRDNKLTTLQILYCDRIKRKILGKVQKYVAENNFAVDISDNLHIIKLEYNIQHSLYIT